MEMTKIVRMAILSTIIAVGLAAITAVHVYYIRDVQRESREVLQHSTAILADRLNGRIREMVHAVESFGAFVTATPSLPNSDAFDHYARQAVLTHATLRALQFVNINGVIVQVFPVEGNESVLGIDLTPLADWAYLEEARRSQRTLVDPNPGPLVQGPMGSIIRTPLYREDAFLGWVQGVYDVENLMHGTEIELNPRQLMQLVDSRGNILLGSTVIPDTTISAPIESGDSMWQLRVAWANPERRVCSVLLASIWGGGLCLIAAALWILHVGWRKEDKLSLAVRWRTAQIEENERKLSAAMRVARLSYWEDNFENRVSWSKDGCRILGVPIDEHSWTWARFMELVYPDDRRLLNESRKLAMQGKSNYQISFRVVHPDGEVQYFEAVGESVLGETGQPIRMIGAVQDVSEQKRAEEKLRESEKRFRDISHSMADWIWEVDKKGHYTFVSDTVKNVLGYDSHELIGKTPFDLMPEEECTKSKNYFFKIASKSLSIRDLVNWNLAKDGTRICLLTNGIPIFDGDGELQGYRGVDKDITRQKQIEAEKALIEDQLRQAQKMEVVGRLAGGVAHDYNNALSVIMGYTELVMDKIDLAEPLRDDLNEVLKAAKRATDITRQLLAFARKQTIMPKVLNLNENVESMLKMVRRLIGEDITLAWLPGADLQSIKMDPSQIDQILANLCVNARDAIPGVGKITIETKKVTFDTAYCANHHGFIPGRFVMLTVSDNGCGMDKEILDNIFEPFFTTKDVDKGTGLGLSTVYDIVKQNNGFINVYSEPGAGTAIKIYLPQHEDNAIDIQWQNTEDIPSGHGETVMVVEDDPSILKLAEKILKGLGYIVLTANRPKGAIKLVKEHVGEIHLLITDVIMPEMNGLELVSSIQTLYPNLKCVFMSGYTSDAIAHHGVLDEGINFVQKPFSKEDLARTVRTALDEVSISVQG